MKKEWVCWKLSKDQIDSSARVVGLDPKRLAEKNYGDIAKVFMKELQRENRQWKLILEDAIETVVRL